MKAEMLEQEEVDRYIAATRTKQPIGHHDYYDNRIKLAYEKKRLHTINSLYIYKKHH